MVRQRHWHRRRATPPKEGVFSSVLGEFLDPIDALFTIFYSILFALLFTLSYSVLIYYGVISSSFKSGYGRHLFFTILGAVTAWGIIDGILYVIGEVFARRERYRLLRYVQASDNDEEASEAIADELDFVLAPITGDNQRHELYDDIREQLSQAEPQKVGLERGDIVGALATLILYVLAVLPSLLPLLLLPGNTALAIRISNTISFVVVFAAGYSWGVHTDENPWKTGFLLLSVCLGMFLVALLLGG